MELLTGWKSEQRQIEEYVGRARERWPEATAFRPEE